MDIILIIYIFIALIIFTKYSDCYTPCERSIMMAILWPLYTA